MLRFENAVLALEHCSRRPCGEVMYERGAIHGQDDLAAVCGVSTSKNPDFWGIAHASVLHLCAKTTVFEKEATHDAESQRRGVACTNARLDNHGTESKFGVVRPLN